MEKAVLSHEKIESDLRVGGRLFTQIQLFRAARAFDFQFAAVTPIAALRQEIETYCPALDKTRPATVVRLLANLEAYKTAAVAAYTEIPVTAAGKTPQTPDQLWEFWRTQSLILPFWWSIAARVGILLTSSCCSERLFATYTSMFDAQQNATLEDKIEFGVCRRFNNTKREAMDRARLHQ